MPTQRSMDDLIKALMATTGESEERTALIQELVAAGSAERTRMFPIQDGPAVPWSVMRPHEAQCQKNHGQSLERIAERGGLSSAEAWAVVKGIAYRDIKPEFKTLWRTFVTERRFATEVAQSAAQVKRVDGCSTCRYHVLTNEDDGEGECRRYAPRSTADGLQKRTFWPVVGAGDWCGERA